MTTLHNRQLSDDELELLSAYIDNQLAAAERAALEQRLGREPALRAALDELRGTVALLRELAPLPPPRSFTLDPAAFAPRPSPLFSWLRMGATLASVLLAITFAIEFASFGGVPASAPMVGGGAAPAAAPTAAALEAQRSAQFMTEAPDALSAPAAAAPTAAPAAAAPVPAAEPTAAPAAAEIAAEPTASTKAAEATTAPAPTSAPAAPAAPEAPAAGAAAPTPSAEATVLAPESADTSTTAASAAQPTPVQAQEPGDLPPIAGEPAGGNIAPPTIAPVTTSGSESPDTAQLDQAAPVEPQQAAPRAAFRPIRLIQFSLAGMALLLGLGALWVRRRGR
jgi:hypothetical protein